MKKYIGSIKVGFSINTNINTETEDQAWQVLNQIADYLQDNITIDCKLSSESDASVDECNVEPNYISEF